MSEIELTEPDLSATAPEHAAVFAAGWRAGQRHLVESMPDLGWRPIETAPEVGDYLIFMPNLRREIMVCRSRKVINGFLQTADGLFMWDHLAKPTHWMPLPELPR